MKQANFSIDVTRLDYPFDTFDVQIVSRSAVATSEINATITKAKMETLVCELLQEVGLTRKVQKALKPMLVDAVHSSDSTSEETATPSVSRKKRSAKSSR